MADEQGERKRRANAEYAKRYPAKSKQRRKLMRQGRTERREMAWLEAMGIERDDGVPLVSMPKKRKPRR